MPTEYSTAQYSAAASLSAYIYTPTKYRALYHNVQYLTTGQYDTAVMYLFDLVVHYYSTSQKSAVATTRVTISSPTDGQHSIA